jgi:hypothetical protein
MVNIVHDELIFEGHKDEMHIRPKLRWLLSEFEEFRAPITAGFEYGAPSWGKKETEEIGFEPLTDEEWKKIKEFDIFDGSVFDIVA